MITSFNPPLGPLLLDFALLSCNKIACGFFPVLVRRQWRAKFRCDPNWKVNNSGTTINEETF